MTPRRGPKFRQGTWAFVWLLDVCCPQAEGLSVYKEAHLDQGQVPGPMSSQYSQQPASECFSPGSNLGNTIQDPRNPNRKGKGACPIVSMLRLFFSCLAAPRLMKFPGQRSDPSHSCNLHCSRGTAGSFNPLGGESNLCPGAAEMLLIPLCHSSNSYFES